MTLPNASRQGLHGIKYIMVDTVTYTMLVTFIRRELQLTQQRPPRPTFCRLTAKNLGFGQGLSTGNNASNRDISTRMAHNTVPEFQAQRVVEKENIL